MMESDFKHRLRRCQTIGDTFELVKEVAFEHTGKDQAGLMVGLADLGTMPHGFIGAYYAPHANIIIINRRILERIKRNTPKLYKPYLFHILLHEYIHSLGVYNEPQTRQLTHKISKSIGHQTILELATDMGRFFPEIVYSPIREPPQGLEIEFVPGIDRKNTSYIA